MHSHDIYQCEAPRKPPSPGSIDITFPGLWNASPKSTLSSGLMVRGWEGAACPPICWKLFQRKYAGQTNLHGASQESLYVWLNLGRRHPWKRRKNFQTAKQSLRKMLRQKRNVFLWLRLRGVVLEYATLLVNDELGLSRNPLWVSHSIHRL